MTKLINKNYSLNIWLTLMCACVIGMIFIGGFTRLTESGLSITEWKPVSGVIPPLDDAKWAEEFLKYKASPEYIHKNSDITLSDFKSLYWVEFIHRLSGRFVGLLYILPMLFFLIRGDIEIKQRATYFGVLALFGLQGLMGWYMVKSGLSSDPYVSHFRLSAHLMLAVFIYMVLFWQLMKSSFDIMLISYNENLSKLSFWCKISIISLLIQMIFGAFVAGLDAGMVYNDFPLMGDYIVPSEIYEKEVTMEFFYNFVNDPVFVQFTHRSLAYILFIIITVFCFHGIRFSHPKFSRVIIYIFLALVTQIILGILTVTSYVAISFALMHQLVAMLLLSLLFWAYFLIHSAE